MLSLYSVIHKGVRLMRKKVHLFWQELITDFRRTHFAQDSISYAEQVGRIQFLNTLIPVFVPIAIIILIIRLIVTDIADLQVTMMIIMMVLVLLVSLYFFVRYRSYHFNMIATVLLGFGMIILNAMNTQPPHLQILYIVILPIFSAMLLSLLDTIIISVVSFLIVLLFGFFTPTVDTELLIDIVDVIIIMLPFILFMSYRRDKIERERRELYAASERNTALQYILTSISHDFRTPLSVINTSLYLLDRIDDPEKRKKQQAKIQQQSQRLAGLIDNVITLANLEHRQSSTLEYIQLVNVVNEIAKQWQPIANGKGTQVILDIDTDMPRLLIVPLDSNQLLEQLIRNAIQYTNSGEVHVRLTTQGNKLHLTIRDTGIGISPDNHLRVFEPFVRVDEARSMDNGGTGLGLTIVKKIVERYNGHITLDSALDKGTTISVVLPLNPLLQDHEDMLVHKEKVTGTETQN